MYTMYDINYTGRFIKNQQKYAELIPLFTSAWKNKNTERKGKYMLYQGDDTRIKNYRLILSP